jgi:hypothetical protein
LVRQALSSRPFSSAGSTSFTPEADSWPMMERAASSAAARTCTDDGAKEQTKTGRRNRSGQMKGGTGSLA